MDSEDEATCAFMMDDDVEFYETAVELLEDQIEGEEILYDKDGSVRKVHRVDYSRGAILC